MRKSCFLQYDTDYISNVMSLRTPQKQSLEILNDILSNINLRKDMKLKATLAMVNSLYPICTDFEHEFFSLAFSLATGVGKTRLMGAFITYLYTNYNIKNFFVVAPNTTIYEKLKSDLGNNGSSKYVFKGVGCFTNEPLIITDDDYKQKNINLFQSSINIYIYNIDKFNKENVNMKKTNEIFGDSFYDKLASLEDLVVIMDESHHYRAEQSSKALNELKPLMGLELTATPLYSVNGKQLQFKNVVYEYPLSKAIEDGYTRTPYAVTRTDIDFFNFGDEQLDKMMLQDGIDCHETIKKELEAYSINNQERLVKPFMLVVCKNISHANSIEKYIRSKEFRNGIYENKTLVVHSKKSGIENDINTRLLLEVEKTDNPIEIVIHVDKLKEGWDVNNLYTIVPLRTAASKILREQMVGRGLRLPYGKRTGVKNIDAVMLTAHDKFNDILEEAKKGDSIFKAGNIIKAEEFKLKSEYAQPSLFSKDDNLSKDYEKLKITKTEDNDKLINKANELIKNAVTKHIQVSKTHKVGKDDAKKIVDNIKEEIKKDEDLGDVFKKNENPFSEWILEKTQDTYIEAKNKFIPIPKIRITDNGVEEYAFADFDLDLDNFKQVPIKNDLLIQNLDDMSDKVLIKGSYIDFESVKPQKLIIEHLREKPEIDYTKCKDLIIKLVNQLTKHYSDKYKDNGMKNIVMMYKRNIANEIYKQMMQHFYYENTLIKEEIADIRTYNLSQQYTFKEKFDLYDEVKKKDEIKSYLFTGVKKGVFENVKFDSHPELVLARILETDKDVINWLRPAPKEFSITYNHGKNYEPDFVIETNKIIYLVEVKGEDKLKDADVIAKKQRAIQYCKVASEWGKANNQKEWNYLFIPSKQVQPNSTFDNLSKQFKEL